MLANIRDREGEQTAMEVLDVLRSLRQKHDDFRMVITGSIGLHHVLKSLKDAKYANSPVNDMMTIEVPPLYLEDAIDLATKLIEGEGIASSDPKEAGKTIAVEADCFPFYIHHIVKALKIQSTTAEPDHVRQIVAAQLVDENDPWELGHYRERIPIYYGDVAAPLVLRILDELALAEAPMPVSDLITLLKQSDSFGDRNGLLELLKLLAKDHYLIRDVDGSYQFRFPLVQRWWKLDRGL